MMSKTFWFDDLGPIQRLNPFWFRSAYIIPYNRQTQSEKLTLSHLLGRQFAVDYGRSCRLFLSDINEGPLDCDIAYFQKHRIYPEYVNCTEAYAKLLHHWLCAASNRELLQAEALHGIRTNHVFQGLLTKSALTSLRAYGLANVGHIELLSRLGTYTRNNGYTLNIPIGRTTVFYWPIAYAGIKVSWCNDKVGNTRADIETCNLARSMWDILPDHKGGAILTLDLEKARISRVTPDPDRWIAVAMSLVSQCLDIVSEYQIDTCDGAEFADQVISYMLESNIEPDSWGASICRYKEVLTL